MVQHQCDNQHRPIECIVHKLTTRKLQSETEKSNQRIINAGPAYVALAHHQNNIV